MRSNMRAAHGLAAFKRQAKIVGVNLNEALTVVEIGREFGMSPLTAMMRVRVVKRQATIGPLTMLAMIQASGKLEDLSIIDIGGESIIVMKRLGQRPHKETFSMEDAMQLGLLERSHWKMWPKSMRLHRALAKCARIVFPDVVGCLMTPEELGCDVGESGETAVVSRTSAIAGKLTRGIGRFVAAVYGQSASFAKALGYAWRMRKRERESNVTPIKKASNG